MKLVTATERLSSSASGVLIFNLQVSFVTQLHNLSLNCTRPTGNSFMDQE